MLRTFAKAERGSMNVWGSRFAFPDLDAPIDGVLIGGDSAHGIASLYAPEDAAMKYACPVAYVWGNHEPYESVIPTLRAQEDARLETLRGLGADIRALHGAATVIAGVRIIGAPLWTDFNLYPEDAAAARRAVGSGLRDYTAARTAPDRLLTVPDVELMHARDKAAIYGLLAEPFDGPTIVMTHHLPVRQVIAPKREAPSRGRILNAGFASDLWSEIRRFAVDVWIYGHSHDNIQWTGQGEHGEVRFISNARGYPFEMGNGFDPAFVLEI